MAAKKKKKTTSKPPVAPAPVEPEVFGDSAADSIRLAETERASRVSSETTKIVDFFLTAVKERRVDGLHQTKAIATCKKTNLKASLVAARARLRELGYTVKNASWIAENNWYTKISWPKPKVDAGHILTGKRLAVVSIAATLTSVLLFGTLMTIVFGVIGAGVYFFIWRD